MNGILMVFFSKVKLHFCFSFRPQSLFQRVRNIFRMQFSVHGRENEAILNELYPFKKIVQVVGFRFCLCYVLLTMMTVFPSTPFIFFVCSFKMHSVFKIRKLTFLVRDDKTKHFIQLEGMYKMAG